MREFASFVASFCGVCVATGGIYMLLPEGKMTKTLKYIIVLTLLSSFIGLFSVNFSIKLSQVDTVKQGQSEYNEEKMLTVVFEKALKINNINFEKIIIFTDKNKEGSITITKVQVYSSEDSEKIISALGNGKDYEVEVIG